MISTSELRPLLRAAQNFMANMTTMDLFKLISGLTHKVELILDLFCCGKENGDLKMGSPLTDEIQFFIYFLTLYSNWGVHAAQSSSQ